MWKQVQYCLIFCFILVSTICKVSNIFQLSNFVYLHETGLCVLPLISTYKNIYIIISTYLQCHIVFVAKKSAVSARALDPRARAAVWECEHLVLQSAARHLAAARLKKLSQHLRAESSVCPLRGPSRARAHQALGSWDRRSVPGQRNINLRAATIMRSSGPRHQWHPGYSRFFTKQKWNWSEPDICCQFWHQARRKLTIWKV